MAPIICTDGAYGAIIAWRDNRPGGTTYHLYAQHADSLGTEFESGPTGMAIFTAENAASPVIMPDDSSGAYIVFQRTVTLETWAQRIRNNGQVAWVANQRVAMHLVFRREDPERVVGLDSPATVQGKRDGLGQEEQAHRRVVRMRDPPDRRGTLRRSEAAADP